MLPAVARIIVNVGHGLNNSEIGSYDQGAPSCFGGPSEHALVQLVADDLLEQPALPVPLVLTPPCSPECAAKHPTYFKKSAGRQVSISHLAWTVRWVNDNAKHGDYLLSLHMDSSEDAETRPDQPSGVSVYFSSDAPPVRRSEAVIVGKAVSGKLGIPFRGAFPASASHRGHLGILDDTNLPALLIEGGFITNPVDVDAMNTCGGEAIGEGIKALYAFRGGQ